MGADAANSLIARNNIVDNAYGVYNAEADGTRTRYSPQAFYYYKAFG